MFQNWKISRRREMKRCHCLLLMLSWIVLSIHAQSPFTLRQCIDYAVRHDVELKDLEAQRLDAAVDVRMERNKFMPSVSARFTNGLSSGFQQVLTKEMAGKYESVSSYNNSAILSVTVPVWSADAQILSLKLQQKKGQIVDARKAERVLSLKMDVVRRFYAVLLAKNRVEEALHQLEQQDTVLYVSNRMFELGLRAQKDVLDAELNREQDCYTLLQEQNAYEMSMIELRNVMSYNGELEINGNIVDDVDLLSLSLVDACNTLYVQHPSMVAAKMQLEAAQMQRKIIKRQYYPSLTFGYEVGTNGVSFFSQPNTSFAKQWRNNAYQGAVFTLQVPIFNRGDVRTQLRKADIATERSLLALEEAKKSIHDDIQVIMADINQSEKSYLQAQETERIADRQYAKALKDYRLGNIPSYELNVYKTKNTMVRLQTIQAETTLRYKKELLKIIFE